MCWRSRGFWHKSGIGAKNRAGGNHDEKREIPAQKAGMGGLSIVYTKQPNRLYLTFDYTDGLTIQKDWRY